MSFVPKKNYFYGLIKINSMKKISILLFIMLFAFEGFNQNLNQLNSIATSKNGTDWVKFKTSTKIKADALMNSYLQLFGLRSNVDVMKLIKTTSDKLGQRHDKYQQTYKGIVVEGAVYIVHSIDGLAKSCNGKLITNLAINIQPTVSKQKAINNALTFVNAEKYMWQDAGSEAQLKSIKNDPNASYYPKAELVIVDKKYSHDAKLYRLAYKLEVYASQPLKKLLIFVDAQTGAIYHSLNMLKNSDKPGTALTQYDGTKTIMMDSVNSTSYRLRENSRGNGLYTFSLNHTQVYTNALEITSTSPYFSTDKVANEAHWASEMTYDYYFQKHGRNSYDNAGAALYSYVHYGTNYLNAFWDGTRMTYGDGGTSGYGPFTSLDVCGHEITHGVSENEAGFVYQDEPGALSESHSDIFGTCIEFFADTAANWTLGEDLNSTAMRSLQNPKLFSQPDTYHGQNWNFDPNSDNGGVHDNDGVGNYWFYMLAKGDTGTNDNGFHYNIHGLGMDTAQAIAYRSLTTYLTPSSQYLDWYFAAVEAATDLYGSCSAAVKETALAWYAAGVGYPLSNTEIFLLNVTSPTTACGLNNVNVGLDMYYAGCDSILTPGKKIVLAYKMDSNPIIYDTLSLTANWYGGDTLQHISSLPFNVSTVGIHTLNCWAKLDANTTVFTDSIIQYQFTNILLQNVDVGPIKILSPISGCGLQNESVSMKFSFFGCDSLPAGDTIPLSYKVNLQPIVTENYILNATMFPYDTITYTFITQANLSAENGLITVQVKTAFPLDTFLTNNTLQTSISNPVFMLEDTITFEETNPTDLFYVLTTNYSHALVSTTAHNTGVKGFLMTGGNAFDYLNILEFPDGTNNWQVNDFLSAKIGFCVNASSWTEASLRFDLKQTDGGTIYTQYIGAGDYTNCSNLRVLANGTQMGPGFKPLTSGSDPFKTHYVSLNTYAGTQFNLEFESRCVSKDTTVMGFPMKMDNVYLDNICITEHPQGFEGIDDNVSSEFLAEVFPNPFTDWYMINMESKGKQTLDIAITDVSGRLVSFEKREATFGHNAFIFNSTTIQQGVYFIKIQGKQNTTVLKIIKN